MPYGLIMQNTVMSNKTEFHEMAIQSPSARYQVASVGRAIDLLEAFLQPPHQFGVTELSRMTGQTKNQSFRLLQTLADGGLIVMDFDTKRYSLGYRMLEWGGNRPEEFTARDFSVTGYGSTCPRHQRNDRPNGPCR